MFRPATAACTAVAGWATRLAQLLNMNAVFFLAHLTGQPHAHSHELAVAAVALLLATAVTMFLRRVR